VQLRGDLAPLPGWPACADESDACKSWATSGECTRNAAYMHSSCAASCGRCDQLRGPLLAVQALGGLGGTAARHVRLPVPVTAVPVSRSRSQASSAGEDVPWTTGRAIPDADARGPHMGAAHVQMRDFLFVANYKAAAAEHVAVYEWHGSTWTFRTHLDAPGAGELAHCPIVATGEHLLVLSTWFAAGSFSASSLVFAYDPQYERRAQPTCYPHL